MSFSLYSKYLNIISKIIKEIALERKVESLDQLMQKVSRAQIDISPDVVFDSNDLSSNMAMLLAKDFKISPMKLAEIIEEKLKDLPEVQSTSIAKPGFLNFKLSNSEYSKSLQNILQEDKNFGFENIGKKEKINVEYVSANPTGPLHIGHLRGAMYGETLCCLLDKVGFDVEREYYINDAGKQIQILLESAFLRYKQVVKKLDTIEIPPSCYPGLYLLDIGKKIFNKYGDSLLGVDSAEVKDKIRGVVLEEVMKMIKTTLSKMGIHHNTFVSEKFITDEGYVDKAIDILRKKDLCYIGKLDPPKGIDSKDWKPEEQEIFKSSNFGDDLDRAIKKSDGSFSYFAPDIGYHYYKYQRGFKKMIMIVGADHKGYVKRITAAVNAITDNKGKIEVKLCELVNFVEEGRKVKSSKRSGKFVTVDDILQELSPEVIKFIMLTRKSDTVLDFDLEKAKEESKDNPVFYVQYSHSRCASLLRVYKDNFGEDFDSNVCNFNSLELPFENRNLISLILYLNKMPVIINKAVQSLDLHQLANYSIELSGKFHSIWNGENRIQFIDVNNKPKTDSLMLLVVAIKRVLSSCLNLFAINPADRM